jgi:two-component system phosphate regulon response regulator PhoB
MSKILVVDDEPDISELVALHLARDGHECVCLTNGLEVFPYVTSHLMLPGQDGLTVFKRLRADSRSRTTPVIILTARAQMSDRISGLELGADDYLTKPFSPRELALRISAVLRRTQRVQTVSEVKTGRFLLDRKNMKLFLATLMENDKAVHTRSELLREVWGYSDEVATRTLDTHVKRLREKLGDAGRHIVTVRGTGYQFCVTLPDS